MNITKFNEKLNKLEGNTYTIEEVITPVNGVYEADLEHDNVEVNTINIYTGSKLTGDKINTYTISTPSLTPWRTHIKIYSNEPTLYITYETTGDTVEADDINNVQNAINDTQKALNEEIDRATKAEKVLTDNLNKEISRAEQAETLLQQNIDNEVNRAENAESEITSNLNSEITRATNAEKTLTDNLNSEINRAKKAEDDEATRAKSAEKTLTDNLNKEINRASSAESILTTNLDKEISRAKSKESSIDTELDNRYTKDKVFTKDEVLNKIKELIGTAPEVLDTFGEIAEALGNDPNFATTITTMLAGKVDKVTGKQLSTNDFDNTQKSNLTDCNNKKHTHSNKSVLDGITSALITAWNNAYSHISDTVKHITSAERTLWNTVSNKADKSHTHTKSQITDMPTKLSQFTNDAGYITQAQVDTSQNHTHSNKTVLDKITEANVKTMNDITKGIGGRNLFTGTKDFTGTWVYQSEWSIDLDKYKGFTVLKKQTQWLGLCQKISAVVGEKYVLSAYVKCELGSKIIGFGTVFTDSGAIVSIDKNWETLISSSEDATEWRRITFPFTVTKSGNLEVRFENSINDKMFYICGLKLEKGTIATDWSPAPEDMLKKGMTWAELEGV